MPGIRKAVRLLVLLLSVFLVAAFLWNVFQLQNRQPNPFNNGNGPNKHTGANCCTAPKRGHFISGMKLHNFMYLKNEDVFACIIPKASSTFLKNVLAGYVKRRKDANVDAQCQVDHRIGLNKSLVATCKHIDESNFDRLSKIAKRPVVITRDPIDRFLSAYQWVCLVNYEVCKDFSKPKKLRHNYSVVEIINKLHAELLESSDQRSQFLVYVWEHFAPAHLFCGFSEQSIDYKFIDMGTNSEERVMQTLQRFGLDGNILRSVSEHNKANYAIPKTSTVQRKHLIKQIAANPKAAAKLLNIYAKDYEMFDYHVPSWLCDAAQTARCRACIQLCKWLNSQCMYRFT